MNRKQFIGRSGLIAGAAVVAPVLLSNTFSRPMSRIGLTTYVFRNRFKSTNKNLGESTLSLLQVPEYFAERFGIHKVEFFSQHFDSLETPYLMDLKKALRKTRSQLVNIQVDTPGFDISDPLEDKRNGGIERLKQWIDAAAVLGSEMVRASRMTKSFEQAVISVRELTRYAASKNIIFLVENHGDMFTDPELHVSIAKELDPEPNFGLIADFGNYPDGSDYLANLKMIAPYCGLVSAKTKEFNSTYQHLSYDFEACVKTMEQAGYKGIYSIEHSLPPGNYRFDPAAYDFERITDLMIKAIVNNLG
jgi:sugar phosphate isomerase/epimerase